MHAQLAAILLVCAALLGGATGTQAVTPIERQADSLQAKVSQLSTQVERLSGLERRVQRLESEVDDLADTGMLAFLFGVFCALWAQNTRRGAWLWFFFGLFLSPIAVVVLLMKNSSDRAAFEAAEP